MNGGYQYIANKIQQHLVKKWTRTHIVFDNLPYTPTQNADFLKCRIRFDHAEKTNLGVSSQHIRYHGYIMCGIFISVDKGSPKIYELADRLCEIFRASRDGYPLGDIVCYEAYLDDIVHYLPEKNAVESVWYNKNVYIPFHCDYCITQLPADPQAPILKFFEENNSQLIPLIF